MSKSGKTFAPFTPEGFHQNYAPLHNTHIAHKFLKSTNTAQYYLFRYGTVLQYLRYSDFFNPLRGRATTYDLRQKRLMRGNVP